MAASASAADTSEIVESRLQFQKVSNPTDFCNKLSYQIELFSYYYLFQAHLVSKPSQLQLFIAYLYLSIFKLRLETRSIKVHLLGIFRGFKGALLTC